jgi:UDP-4-amino-4,6-dideoxy-N-acetyl-beta-L-altrosamine transaminase
MIPYGKQSISDEDIRAVVEVLKSDFLTQGPVIDRFEAAVAEACGAKYAVAVANGTASLHVACLAARVGPGDLVWTSPVTFVASANCARYCGADVDFVDIDPATFNLSLSALEEKLAAAKHAGRLPKMLVPVHLGGQSCDMEAIRRLTRPHGILILEDAAHAFGGSHRGKAVGACEFSDMASFSFHPVKIVTTCEGGVVTTNSDELNQRLRMLRTHGITRDEKLMRGDSDGGWYYQMLELGFNYRISDVHAALGLSQMSRLQEFVRRRNQLAARYREKLAGLPLKLQAPQPDTVSAYHLALIKLDLAAIGRSHREVYDRMRASGIGVNLHYIPVHLQPYYADLGFRRGQFPQAEAYYDGAMTLPLHYGLTDEEQDRVVEALKAAIS